MMTDKEKRAQERKEDRKRIAAIRALAAKRDTTPMYHSNRSFSIWADTSNDPK
jgi:hypothetical protein